MGSRPAEPVQFTERAAAFDALHEEIARLNMFPFRAATPGAQTNAVQRLIGDSRRAAPFLWLK